ncbi:MAG: glycosyltransferase family 2 protein [Chitinophagaceae bacterium]|nr:MAG: glycosyltransferase family 2 protein [Chitinophagaceae bacterium]
MAISPKVSVLIPTYNYAHFLDETIQSVLNQTFADYELIIVDNNSTDKTDDVVGKYLSDPRISYHKNQTNLGLAGNWNKCLEYAGGEYIKFLCADDKFHPELLEKFVSVMDSHPGVSLITCDKEVFHAKSFVTKVQFRHMLEGKSALLNTLNDHCWIGEPSSVMFRRKNLSVGKFTTEYIMHIDWEMWLRMLTVGDCYVVPETLSYIRYHPEQHARKMKKMKYVICFEEYNLAKDVQLAQKFQYQIDSNDQRIRNAVKKRATFCVRHAMFKIIPQLYRKESWPVFKKAFTIGYREGVFGAAVMELFKGFRINAARLVSR